jgi:protein-tyrosine phosphatase
LDVVLSLLTVEEDNDLDLRNEEREVQAAGMKFMSLPIPDRQVPGSESELTATIEQLDANLSSGKNVAVHCRQGIGRTGLVTSCLLVSKGLTPEQAVKRVKASRGLEIPETAEQRRWIDHYATVTAGVKHS